MNFCVGLILLGLTVTMADHRSKRFLIFPPTSPTRMQLIAGIGVPVELEYESVTIGYVLKAEYFLPDNTTLLLHFLQDPFNPITHPIANRRQLRSAFLTDSSGELLQKSHDPVENDEKIIDTNSTTKDNYEKYDVEAIEIDTGLTGNDVDDDDDDDDDGGSMTEYDDSDWNEDNDDKQYTAADYRVTQPNDFSTARWTLFKGIEMMAERKGLAGRSCMLRSICESAHAPFSFSSGILGELMHILMTPSTTKDTMNDHSQNEYLRAEELGRSGEPCDKVFKECTTSVLDQFSGIYNSMENLIKMFG